MAKSDYIEKFLIDAGFEDCERYEMTPDASYRRYERIVAEEGTYILMIVPTESPMEDGQSGINGVLKPFLEMRDYLYVSDFKVPKILFKDIEKGLLLLEDLGRQTLYNLCQNRDMQEKWYPLAVDNLVHLAHVAPKPELPRFNEELVTIRGKYFLDDYIPLITGEDAKKEHYEELESILKDLYGGLINVPWGSVLWDYHSPNLMAVHQLPKGRKSIALLDFQDAKVGPLSYDLACLLYDARLHVPSKMREELLQMYLEKLPHIDRNAFITSFAIAGLIRNMGVLGRLSRVVRCDQREEYKKFLPQVAKYIEEGCTLHQAKDLKDFLKRSTRKKGVIGKLFSK